MSDYNNLLNCHFRGRPQIAEEVDGNYHRTMRVYYIDSDRLVGISDGIDSWIASAADILPHLKLPRLLAEAEQGKFPTLARRRVLIESQEPPSRPRRRLLVEQAEPPIAKGAAARKQVQVRRRVHVD